MVQNVSESSFGLLGVNVWQVATYGTPESPYFWRTQRSIATLLITYRLAQRPFT